MTTGWTQTLGKAVTWVRAGRAVSALRGADSESARHLARARLAALLGSSRGIAMKVGQLAASDADSDPMRILLLGVPAVPLSVLQPQIEAALGAPLATSFVDLAESEAAASLGQVHRATLNDGMEVAVKVRYPDIAAAVRSELALAGLMPGVGPVRKWGFDLTGYKRVLSENMASELDYRDEAARQVEYACSVHVDGLVVPRVVLPMCRESLLVQSWEEGHRLGEARQWPKKDRLELGRVLIENLFASLFVAGLVHGDPHPGNYLVRRSTPTTRAQLILLDYGCTVRVSAPARLALLHLILRTREGGELDALSAFAAMGFAADKLEPLQAQLSELCTTLFRPFVEDGSFRVSEWQLGKDVERACGELKWWFRAAGPPELLLLMRAFQGLCQHLTALDVALPWWPLLKRVVGDDRLVQASNYCPPRPQLVEPGVAEVCVRARLLRVRVTERGIERASLALPAREVLHLDRVIPEDILRRIEHKGIDVRIIQEDVFKRGIAPGDVFVDVDDGRELRVWLE